MRARPLRRHRDAHARQLTKGNFITEYPVPTPVYSAIESKWTANTKSTEFSCVFRRALCRAQY